jgi:putative peptide-modifying radical SAM enzyme
MNEFDNGLDKKFKFCFTAPVKSKVSTIKLKEFFDKDENPILIFYGGEPLLEIEKIKDIMDNMNIPFRMQTNGLLLHKLPTEYMNRIGKILISLDGDKDRTDFNRGRGVYDRVIRNIKFIREKGYNGEIVARMTLSFPDIYEQTLNLINFGFNSIHWQIDAEFYKNDFDFEKFSKFVAEYNKSISKLADFWVDEMRKGKVIMIYPFIGIIQSLLKNEKTKLRCGAGYEGYAITTDGKIIACPIMNGIENFKAGDLDSNPNNLKKFEIEGRCLKCNKRDLCGGRCLYSNSAGLWPIEGEELVCRTIKYLINEMEGKELIIRNLIGENIIKKSDFEYEKYFGPEIIP